MLAMDSIAGMNAHLDFNPLDAFGYRILADEYLGEGDNDQSDVLRVIADTVEAAVRGVNSAEFRHLRPGLAAVVVNRQAGVVLFGRGGDGRWFYDGWMPGDKVRFTNRTEWKVRFVIGDTITLRSATDSSVVVGFTLAEYARQTGLIQAEK